jgi:hypothetical protein
MANKITSTFLTITGVLIAAFNSSPVSAQFFGPKNYDECMLEKMKGQAPNMASIASRACLQTFPREILLGEPAVTSTWCGSSDDTISACATVKPEYKVTRAEAIFTRAKCDSPDANFFQPDFEASVAAPLFGSTYKFPVKDARLYPCARFSFYGYKKP